MRDFLNTKSRVKRVASKLSACSTEKEKREIEKALLAPTPIQTYIGVKPKRTLSRNPDDTDRGASKFL